MPVDYARAFRLVEASGPDLRLVKTAVARFNSSHPYLLFGQSAIPSICDRANSHPNLIARLKTSLAETDSASAGQELRTRIKRQGRRLIHTSFLALISDGVKHAGGASGTAAPHGCLCNF